MYTKMTKAQIRATLRNGKAEDTLLVYVCGNKMYPTDQTAFTVKLFWSAQEEQLCVAGQSVFAPQSDGQYREIPRTFEAWLNSWAYYNSIYETGYTPAFYRITKG